MSESVHVGLPLTLREAVAKAQAEFPEIPKDKKNTHFNQTYSSLDAIKTACWPPLLKYGVSPYFVVDNADGRLKVTFVLEFVSTGERDDQCALVGPDLTNPQAIGGLITYFKRYTAGARLGITPDEDDDGNVAAEAAKESEHRRPRESAPRLAPPPEQQNVAAPTVTEVINGCQSAAALAKFLQESVGRWPVAKFAEKWPKIIALTDQKLVDAQWPAEQAAIVTAVLSGIRNELTPLTGNPANAPSLERLVGWVDNQESPQDLLNVAASIEGSAKFSDLRANAERMLDVIDAIDVHASALVKGGAWTEDDFDELKRRLLAMNRKYQLEVQSTEAFGGGNEAQEVTV